ncbi:hypothetical protein ACO9S2_11865 [Nitrospira sp. NS4]|uniref:hypothetical protein n=1 Tax=Nitrospira sp. NS4 TaxID=3414498 RepID=UPI003C2DC41A
MNIRMLSWLALSMLLLLAGCSDSGSDGSGITLGGGLGAVVYLADQDTLGVFELYDVASGTKLNPALTPPKTIRSFALTQDGSAVVYIADQDTPGTFELYRVSLAAPGISDKLSGVLAPGGNVMEFAVTPDSSAVVYRADQTFDEVFELYRTVFAGLSRTKLNPDYLGSPAKDIDAFVIMPNGSGVVYRADQDTDGVSELYRVSFANAPISTRLISPAMVATENVGAFAVTPDSSKVVFIANLNSVTVDELFFVLSGGGATTRLNDVLVPNGNVDSFAITPDSLAVVYRADQDEDEMFELYRKVIAGGLPDKLNLAFGTNSGKDVRSFAVLPDSSGVVYIADQTANEVFELYRTRFGGGNARLNPAFVGAAQEVFDFVITPDSSAVVYRADQDVNGVNELYRVLLANPGSSTRINPALDIGENVAAPGTATSYAVSPDSSAVVYRANQDNVNIVELFRTRFVSMGLSVKLNSPLVVGEDVAGFALR